MKQTMDYRRGFVPYALAAFLIGIVGGFSTVLGPAFVADLGIAYGNTTWTALAQAISTAACAPILGKIGDAIGRRRTLLLGIAVFTLGNFLSALSGTLEAMLLARFVVGLGTAAISPVIVSYIATQFPPDRAAGGFSAYMLISSAAVIFGPTLGGLIIAAYGWRAMLWVCVAVCAAVFVSCLLTAKKDARVHAALQNFDVAGAVLVLIFFGLMLCLPAFGQNIGWHSTVFLAALAAAAVFLILLVAVERKAAMPILPGKFIRRKAFFLSVLGLFLTQGLLQANMTNVIVFVGYTQPTNTAVSGYAISVMYLGMSLGALFLGPLADRLEPKRVLPCSLLLTLIGCALMLFFSETTPSVLFMLALGVLGLGLGGNGTIFMKTALSRLPAAQAGAGSGSYALFRDLAAPFGVAVFVPMFTNRVNDLLGNGLTEAQAAVGSIRNLAAVELVCVLAGIVSVLFLPNIHKKENFHETSR